MAESRAAIRYAKALLSLATEQSVAEVVNADMKNVAQAIKESNDLKQMLLSPVVRSSNKKEVLKQIFSDVNATSFNLIDVLITNKRIALLEDVANKYTQLFDALRESQIAHVTTAVELTKDLEDKVLSKVKELTGKTTEIKNTIDASIIGGFILRVGDLQYDASVSNKLNNLKREFSVN